MGSSDEMICFVDLLNLDQRSRVAISSSRLLFSVLSVLGRGGHLDPRFLEQVPLCIALEVGSVGVYFFKLGFR